MIRIILIAFSLSNFWLFAQESQKKAFDFESELKLLSAERNGVVEASNEQQRDGLNAIFYAHLKSLTTNPLAFEQDYAAIPYLGSIISPDGELHMLCWNLMKDQGAHEYYCILMRKNEGNYSYFYFKDLSDRITQPEKRILNHESWYGALYYDIIEIKKGKKKYYTLLGWDGNSLFSTKKIIDVLYFAGDVPKFGASIFKMDNGIKKRVILEYSKEASITVRYHDKHKQIIFDHLIPQNPELEGVYQYYVPDMTFDSFSLKKGKWIFSENTDIRMEKKHQPYSAPKPATPRN